MQLNAYLNVFFIVCHFYLLTCIGITSTSYTYKLLKRENNQKVISAFCETIDKPLNSKSSLSAFSSNLFNQTSSKFLTEMSLELDDQLRDDLEKLVIDKPSEAKQSLYQKRRHVRHRKFSNSIKSTNIDISVFIRKDLSLTIHQVTKISEQLGYLPLNIVKVGAFDFQFPDTPVVSVLYPLHVSTLVNRYTPKLLESELKPFPTIYWMTCPTLQAIISQIEEDGWVELLENKLVSSPEYVEIMEKSHQQYIEARWDLLSPEDKLYVEKMKWKDLMFSRGIAGLRNFKTVKCLHCHYSHFLARPDHNNIVGYWVHEILLRQQSLVVRQLGDISAPLSIVPPQTSSENLTVSYSNDESNIK